LNEKYPKEKIDKAVKVLLPDWKQPELVKEKLDFSFNNEQFSLAPDEVWMIANPFTQHRFLKKSDAVAVLLDNNFVEYSDKDGVDYEMIGQGNNKREDQSYRAENANKAIKNKDRRVFLFKKINNGNVFFDEVEYVGHEFVKENGVDSRNIIIFHLKSKFRKLLKRKIV
jgi:hypothetical protein